MDENKMKPVKDFDLLMGQLSLNDSSDNEFRILMGKLSKYWKNHWRNREQVKAEQHRLMWARASPALNDLLSVGRETDGEKLFNKLVAFCIVMSGLGSPRSEAVVKETYPALQSVVKKTDAAKLADLGRSEREQHLLELVQIVMGIRLFNKDCCKGGEGIDDLPELLTRAVQAAKLQHLTAKKSIKKHLDRLSSVAASFYKLENHELISVPSLPALCSAKDLDRLKSALCLFWAQYFYLGDLFIELTVSEQSISTCVEQLRETLVQLHETVRYRAAIPTIQVYPLFVQLSLIWRELQYEAAVLSHFSQILKAVSSTTDNLDVPFESMQIKNFCVTDDFTPSASKFNGFCPWTLVQTGGVLFPGIYNKEDLKFRSPEAANVWFQDLSVSYSRIHSIVNAFPELQHFVKIDSEVKIEPEQTPETPVTTADAETQTEIHPIESHIDRNYAWSEWELKQRSVKLAKLVTKSTKSQQTIYSNFRVNKKI